MIGKLPLSANKRIEAAVKTVDMKVIHQCFISCAWL